MDQLHQESIVNKFRFNTFFRYHLKSGLLSQLALNDCREKANSQ